MERPRADSEEKREPVSDIDTAGVDSLKALDPKRPIREADIDRHRIVQQGQLRRARRRTREGRVDRWRECDAIQRSLNL
jgi:hypothetical protein